MPHARREGARMPAEERRELVLEAAAAEFALRGFDGTSAEAIAHRAGISQPYLFRLFGTKRELFLEVVERMFDAIDEALRAAAGGAAIDALPALAAAYEKALGSDSRFLLQLQCLAACDDDEIRFAVRRRFAATCRYLEQASGAPAGDVRAVVANGMFKMAAAALQLPQLAAREPWARRLLAEGPGS